MTEVTLVKIEDGRDCIILEEIACANDRYVLLVNSQNKDDYIIRKVQGEELVGLENEEEFKKVFTEFLKTKVRENTNE